MPPPTPRPSADECPDPGAEHPLALPVPVGRRRPGALDGAATSTSSRRRPDRRRVTGRVGEVTRPGRGAGSSRTAGPARPGRASVPARALGTGPARRAPCGRRHARHRRGSAVRGRGPRAAGSRPVVLGRQRLDVQHRASRAISRSGVDLLGEPVEHPVDLVHPVAAQRHRQLQRPQVVAGASRSSGSSTGRAVRQRRRHLLAAAERERRGQEQHAADDEQRRGCSPAAYPRPDGGTAGPARPGRPVIGAGRRTCKADDGAAAPGPPDVRRRRAGRDGDRQPHPGLVLRPGRDVRGSTPRWPRSTGRSAEGAAIVDIGGVKAGPGDEVDAGRGAAPDRRAGRGAVRGRAPGPGDQRGHLAGRGGQRCWPARAPTCSTTPGAGSTRRSPSVAAATGAGLVCAHAGGLAPRTRPHRVAYDDVVADVVATVTGLAERAVEAGRAAGRDPDRPGARLRQEHPALAGGHPPARRAGRRPAGRCWCRCPARTSSARPSTCRRTGGWRGRWPRPRSRPGWAPGCSARTTCAATRRVLDMVASIRGTRPPGRDPPRAGLSAGAAGRSRRRPAASVDGCGRAAACPAPPGGRTRASPGRPARPTAGRRGRPGRAPRPAWRACRGCAAVHTSKNSSSVPIPPGSTRNASARRSISALRSRMVSTTTSSSTSWSATSIATRWCGITPTVWPPAGPGRARRPRPSSTPSRRR